MTAYDLIARHVAELSGAGEAEIRPETWLNLRGGLSRIDRAKLFIRVEKAFRITIDDLDAADIRRVSDLVKYVDARRKDGRDDYAQPDDETRAGWYYE